jgi:prepilin-type N-terminal cleavage/methylation domain-containing protein
MTSYRRAVSLVEVLVVSAVVAVLLGLVLAAVQKSRAAAARTASLNDVRQILEAVQQHAAAHDGTLAGWCT